MSHRIMTWILLASLGAAIPARAAEILLVDDPLDHGTIGERQGGVFVEGGGWQAEAGEVRIVYDLGRPYAQGRFEVDVRNFLPCSQPNNEKCHIVSMWQGENQDRDSSAAAGESHWIWRTGTGYFGPPCEYKLLTRPEGFGEIGYEARLDQDFPWDPAATYHYSISWEANGRVVMRKRHPGGEQLLYDYTHGLPLRLRYLLLGRDRATKPNYGEQPGVIYSNLQVFVEAGSDDAGPDGGFDGGTDGGQDGGDGSARTLRLEPVEDTFAHLLEPDLPHGDQATVQVGGDGAGDFGRVVYFRFDLSQIAGSVRSARLVLRATNAGGGGWITGVPDNGWQEETLTWNNRPMAGAQIIDQLGRVEIDNVYAFDMTHSVYAGGVYSFAILSVEDDGAAYGSKEHPEADYRPYLELLVEGEGDGGPEPDAGQDAGAEEDGAGDGQDAESPADPGADAGADAGADPGPDGAPACLTDSDCPAGQTCRQGVCLAKEPGSCGCSPASGAPSVLLPASCLALLLGRRRIRSRRLSRPGGPRCR